MKLARFLFKPRWQSKDVATRRGAVAELSDAELVAALPTIARNDSDAGVRLAALRRLNQYEAWRERSTGDADGSVRETARAAYLAMLTGGSADLPALERRIAELDTLSGEEIERVVAYATDPALRSAALERATRPSLLADVAANDADPKLRLIALSRITDLDALVRVAERTRKTDKVVSRLARERAEAGRIAAGDVATIEARARQLCERVEALLSRPRGERLIELDALEQAWLPLTDKAPAQLRERFASTRAFLRGDTEEAAAQRQALRDLRLRIDAFLAVRDNPDVAALEALVAEANHTIAALTVELPERERVEARVVELARRLAALAVHEQPMTATPAPTPAAVAAAVAEANPEAIAAQARFEAALERAQADKEKQREQHHALRLDLDALVVALEQQLEAGDLVDATATHARISNLLEGLPTIARHDKRLANAEARFAELKRWQRWSNNERRKQLCEAIEALPASGLHPDAVATRVREARTEWQQLDAQEQADPKEAARSSGMGRRFQALCAQALKPAQGYFAKRDELRKSNQQEIETLLQASEALANDSNDWNALAKQRRDASAGLRDLDGVEPRARKLLAQRLKDVLTKIDTRLDEHAREIETAKRKLIADAERNAGNADGAAAAREVRELQARWKALGNGRRRTDEAQWKLFREQCDAVFAKLDSHRREREQADVDARNAAEELLLALQQLAQAENETQRSTRRDLEQRWSELGQRDRELENRWQQAREVLDQQLRAAERARRDAVFSDALARLTLCEALEAATLDPAQAQQRWAEAGTTPSSVDAALQTRWSNANAGVAASADDDSRRDVLVRLEFMGTIETPESDRKRRMDLQVQRLSQHMAGTAALAPRDELLSLLQRWVELGALPTDGATWRARFERAFDAALAQLP